MAMTESRLPVNSIYEEIGIKPMIHAGGTNTDHGGSTMRPEVIQAMVQASQSYVPIAELNSKVGDFMAQVTGAEAGMVTAGAGSGIVLSAAACMTGTDKARILQLPDTRGMKAEIVIAKAHRGPYSHMYTFAGASLVEVGEVQSWTADELDAAINDNTAAVAYLLAPRISRRGPTLKETVEIAHGRGVPVVVDAAAMLPPKSNLSRYIADGADLVTVSGGKDIRGPQGSGMLFGRKDLVAAALANHAPNHAIGRPHKVSREDMVGLWMALKLYVEHDEKAEVAGYRATLSPVVEALNGIDGIEVSIRQDDFRFFLPNVVVRLTPDWNGPSGPEVRAAMMQGEPRIGIRFDPDYNELEVNAFNMQAGEPAIVGARLREELLRR
jgi:L-seryl-tRNA(Ser) seleniumtransferase